MYRLNSRTDLTFTIIDGFMSGAFVMAGRILAQLVFINLSFCWINTNFFVSSQINNLIGLIGTIDTIDKFRKYMFSLRWKQLLSTLGQWF